MKSITFIFNKAPYGDHSGRELLDICLMSAAFEMPITAIFQDAGVYQLLKDQQPEIIDVKNHSATFKALELYGIEQVWLDKASFEASPLTEQDLLAVAELVESSQIQQQIAASDFVISL